MTPPSETKGYGHADAVQTYQIRPATMEDSPAIRQIRNAAVREALAIWTSIEQDPARAETWLAPMVQRGTALVAHVSGKPHDVIGFAVAGPRHSYEGYTGTPTRATPAQSRTRSTSAQRLKAKGWVPGSSPLSSRRHGRVGTVP